MIRTIAWLTCIVALAPGGTSLARPAPPQEAQQLARDVCRELIEINTVTATGDSARAAEAMAARLRAAGFAGTDVQVFTPAPRKGNLVARLRGSGGRKPILLLAHLDVVEAKRDDWSFDPFKLTGSSERRRTLSKSPLGSFTRTDGSWGGADYRHRSAGCCPPNGPAV